MPHKWRWFVAIAVVVFVVTPAVWRYARDRALPWSTYPRTTTDVTVEPNGGCLNAEVFAFGNYWTGVAPAEVASQHTDGTFRQIDATHAVFRGITLHLQGKFNDLECDIANPDEDPRLHLLEQPLPMTIQPPNPCHLLTTEELATTIGPVVADPAPPTLATDNDTLRTCLWKVSLNTPFHPTTWPGVVDKTTGTVAVEIMTDAAQAGASAAASRVYGHTVETTALSVLFAQDGSNATSGDVLGYPAYYEGDTPSCTLWILTPTTLMIVSVDGDDEAVAAATKLADYVLGRVNATGP